MRRASALGGCAALVLALHCGSDHTATFTRDGDASFVASVAGAYAAIAKSGEVVSLTLCEDTSRDAVACVVPEIGNASDCPSECHAIKGAGRGSDETLSVERSGCGCGGAHADLAVVVTLSTAGGSTRLTGIVNLSPSESDPYGEPRRVFVSTSNDRSAPSDASGFFRHDGQLELQVHATAAPRPPVEVADASAADAATPGRPAEGGLPDTTPGSPFIAGEELVFAKAPGDPCRSP